MKTILTIIKNFMKNQILTSIFIVAGLAACNSKEKDSTQTDTSSVVETGHGGHQMPGSDERTIELMAIHDSIMPSMSTILNLKSKISEDIKTTDSLIAIKSSDLLKSRKALATSIKAKLEKADTEMMGWMHQYKADTLKSLDSTQAAAYIESQKLKIETVRDQMEESIKEAQSFILKK